MKISRRAWMAGALGAGAIPLKDALAVTEAYPRSGSTLKVGLAAYSFRSRFEFMKGKPNKSLTEGAEPIDMVSFIEWCASQGVAGAELTSYFFVNDVEPSYLAECRRVGHVNGVDISGTAVGNNFSYPRSAPERAEQMDYVKRWIDYSMIMGAPHIRVFAGKHPKGVSGEEAEANAIDALSEAAEFASERGVMLGIENHDSISTADRLLRIVKAVDSPWVGVNLDSGNFIADDVYAEMEASAPYAINVQLKTEIKLAGGKKEPVDMERVINILKDSGYAGYAVLEYEEDKDPFEHIPPILEKLQKLCQ